MLRDEVALQLDDSSSRWDSFEFYSAAALIQATLECYSLAAGIEIALSKNNASKISVLLKHDPFFRNLRAFKVT
jgi:hypothetical protein